MRLVISDKAFLAFSAAFFFFMIYISLLNSPYSDEGTHLLLSVFYRDLANHIVQTGDLSFSGIYNYGINYLIHYPKLQIAYPPLYHLTNAFLFFFIHPSEVVGRAVNLFYAVMSFGIFYLLAKKYFGGKPALAATLLFALSPFTLFFSSRAMQDFTMIFWMLASLFFFDRSNLTDWRYLALSGLSAALAFLGKQMGGFLIPLYILFIFLGNTNLKFKLSRLVPILLSFAVIVVPYLLILNYAGGIEINTMVAIGYAQSQGEPTTPLNPYFWTYYLIAPVGYAPFSIVLVLSLAYYIYKKNPKHKEMAIFFALFYLALSIIPNKEIRFSQLFMLPAYAAAGVLLYKVGWRKAIPVLLIYFVVSLAIFVPTIGYYPVKEIAYKINSGLPDGAGTAMLSDDDPAFSSVFMFYSAAGNRTLLQKYYRPCAFNGLNGTELSKALKERSVYYVVFSNWSSNKQIEGIMPHLIYEFGVNVNGKNTSVYRFNKFTPVNYGCNFVCLIDKTVCYDTDSNKTGAIK